VTSSIDYASLFSGTPAGPSQNVKFRQGQIVTFNPNTLQNTVAVGGAILTDLPILGVAEASTLVTGASVGVLVVGDDERAKTMFIIGRSVIPNTADATNAITLLNQQIFTSEILTGETCSSTTYTDLATVGPQVTVNVGPSGRLLIIGSAQAQWTTGAAGTTNNDARFNLQFDGANVRVPTVGTEPTDPLVGITKEQIIIGGGGTNSTAHIAVITDQAVFSGLNTGPTTITMKYRDSQAAVNPCDFFRRTLTVVRL
jgi:hypothetical protein